RPVPRRRLDRPPVHPLLLSAPLSRALQDLVYKIPAQPLAALATPIPEVHAAAALLRVLVAPQVHRRPSLGVRIQVSLYRFLIHPLLVSAPRGDGALFLAAVAVKSVGHSLPKNLMIP